MKIALVYNHDSRDVINPVGAPNRERIGFETIEGIHQALEGSGHQVELMEADKNLIDRLEKFMPRAVKGETPGLVFNLAYGIQGRSRYTHVPSILEMLGVPYVASGPLAHSLALDKAITKVLLRDHGIPTPDWFVLETPDGPLSELAFPLIVKPRSEAVSFGLKVVQDEAELREAATRIHEEFQEPILVEQFIEGRELNVGLIGNDPPEAFTPVEVKFGKKGPPIFTYEDKSGRSGRKITYVCPPKVDEELCEAAQDVARRAFLALGCSDCARVDIRVDEAGNVFVLEVNSLPSLGRRGSYRVGAKSSGLDFDRLIARLIEVASARYFGAERSTEERSTDSPRKRPSLRHALRNRDELEQRLSEWVEVSSRTTDAVGIQRAVQMADESMKRLGLKTVEELSNRRSTWLWETPAGFEEGMLLVAPLDVPLDEDPPKQPFRREREWLYGEGVATSRSSLVTLEFALHSLRAVGALKATPLGVLLYSDEGRDARYSGTFIRKAAEKARRVLVLDAVPEANMIAVRRGGEIKYGFRCETPPRWLGEEESGLDVVDTSIAEIQRLDQAVSRGRNVRLTVVDFETERLPALHPYKVTATLLLRYLEKNRVSSAEEKIRTLLEKSPNPTEIRLISKRPPLPQRAGNDRLARAIVRFAKHLDLDVEPVSLSSPSVAGLVPARTACVSGLGPHGRDFGTSNESVNRLSLTQRALLLVRLLSAGRATGLPMSVAS